MKRRAFLGTALAATTASPLLAALRKQRWDDAAEVLERATQQKQVHAAVLHVAQRDEASTRYFGQATSDDAMFLLGSISKPRLFQADVWAYRFDGHALLGRSGDGNHLRGAHVAAAPRGRTPSA